MSYSRPNSSRWILKVLADEHQTPGYNSKISYDPANDMTLIVWTNLAVSLDDQQTANTLWVNVLDQIYQVSPLAPAPSLTAAP